MKAVRRQIERTTPTETDSTSVNAHHEIRRIESMEDAMVEYNRRAVRLEEMIMQIRDDQRTLVERLASAGPAPLTHFADDIAVTKVGYSQAIAEIQQIGRKAFPRRSIVAVVSKGDDRLLDLGEVRGWHFPQTEAGTYVGHHPADSASAIAHLDRLYGKGAHFLLMPCTAYWWLDYYGEFRKYLLDRYPCTWQSSTCRIYQLRPLGEVSVIEQETALRDIESVLFERAPMTLTHSESGPSLRRRYRLEQAATDRLSISGRIVERARGGGGAVLPPVLVIENALGERVASPTLSVVYSPGRRHAVWTWSFTAQIDMKDIIRSNCFKVIVVNGKTSTAVGDAIRFGVLFDIKADQASLSGWALDPDDPSARVSVSVRSAAKSGDGAPVKSRATLFRDDLRTLSGRDGFFGFQVPWTEGLPVDVELRSPLKSESCHVVLDSLTESLGTER